MGFYIQDDFWEACAELPEKTQDEVFGSLVRLFFKGDKEPDIKGTSKAMFVAFRDRVLIAKKRSEAGKSKPNQNDDQNGNKPESNGGDGESKPDAAPEPNDAAIGDQGEGKTGGHLLKGESERKKGKEKALKEPPLPPMDECDNEAAAFAVEALAAFNAITGQDVRDMPGDAWCGLRRVFDAGRTIDDVKTVIEKKNAAWRDNPRMAKFVRPSTLFGDKFDEYLNQKDEGDSNDAEASEYAAAF